MAEQSKTVDAALTLLRLVADHHGASTASLARALGQSRSAVGRMLATLEAHGLSRRADHGWTAGLGLLALAAVVEPELRAVARAELDALADRFDETAVLSVRDGDEAVAIEQARGAPASCRSTTARARGTRSASAQAVGPCSTRRARRPCRRASSSPASEAWRPRSSAATARRSPASPSWRPRTGSRPRPR